MERLGAVRVEREEADEVISELRERGLLDPWRRVKREGGFVEVPVTGGVEGFELVEQGEPLRRDPDVSPRERVLGMGFSEERVPGSWEVLGGVLLADLGGDVEVAGALLEAVPGVESVLDYGGVSGRMRRPEVELLAGEGDTETVHVEDGIRYVLDPSEVMFSTGNREERRRVRGSVGEGERVLDMFCCVGQFSLPAAVGGGEVVGMDVNPVAVRYLSEAVELNGVGDRVSVVVGDSSRPPVSGGFDRVLMGHLDSPGHLPVAVEALGDGGWIHYHEAAPLELEDRPVERVRGAVEDGGLDVLELERRLLKGYAPGVGHFVVDCRAG